MREIFDVKGMHCASCVARLTTALEEVAGVEEAQVNLATESAVLKVDPATFDARALESLAGFRLVPHGTEPRNELAALSRDMVLPIAAGAVVSVLSMGY